MNASRARLINPVDGSNANLVSISDTMSEQPVQNLQYIEGTNVKAQRSPIKTRGKGIEVSHDKYPKYKQISSKIQEDDTQLQPF